MKKPNFFIVGAPKCGTTALYAYLRQHPDIFMPSSKEPHFFAKDLEKPDYVTEYPSYIKLFAKADKETCIGEASVWYLYSRCAAQEIYQFDKNAQIIIMLRNPVDMIYSYHSQRLFNGTEDQADFAQALALEPLRKQGRHLPKNIDDRHGLYYSEIAQYDVQIKRYFDLFPREQIHIILFDRFKVCPKQCCDETIALLGAKVDEQQPFTIVNANKTVRSAWLRDLILFPPEELRERTKFIPPSARGRLIMWLRQATWKYNRKEQLRTPMASELRAQLQQEFSPSVLRLGELLEVDLSHWALAKA